MTTDTAWVESVVTPDGPFTWITNPQGEVLAAGWSADPELVRARIHPSLRPATLTSGTSGVAEAVLAYYDGDLDAISRVPVRQAGTEFQQQGWAALNEIAPGEPLTYAEFAQRLGRASAVRPAAAICARNAPALFVPCHRVLRSDGSLGGFAWGTEIKQSLLAREAALAR